MMPDARQMRLLRLVYAAHNDRFEKYMSVDQCEWIAFRGLRRRGLLKSNGNSTYMEMTPKGVTYSENPELFLIEDVMNS